MFIGIGGGYGRGQGGEREGRGGKGDEPADAAKGFNG